MVTARHCVTGRNNNTGKPLSQHCGIPNKIKIWHNKKGHPGSNISIELSLLTEDKQPLWYEHPILGELADIIALKLSNLEEVDLYPYNLCVDNELLLPRPSDTISVVGFPFGLTVGQKLAIWSTGFLASEPDIDYENQPKFLIDCRTRQGQSGSAVVAQHNEGVKTYADNLVGREGGYEPYTHFIGIYSGRVKEESDLGFVWKKSAILQLVDSIT